MIDFTEQMEASKFEYEASKCKTKQDRIKFCQDYLVKQNKQSPGSVLLPTEPIEDKTDWAIDPVYNWENQWEVLKVDVSIDDWLLWSINKEPDDAIRQADQILHIHKKAYTQLMDEVVKKGYVTIEKQHSIARNVTTFEHRMTVRKTK